MLTFNADEIFEIAETIERNGAAFYRKAAEGVSDPKSRQVLLDLSAMELQHERTFAAMRAGLSEDERAATVFDPDDQAGLYLQALADGKVFDFRADPSQRLTGKEKMGDILRTAIGLEKDSIIFYLGMKSLVSRRAGQVKLDDIVREEMGHIATLSGQLIAAK
jgi:rubrerythrin